MNADPASPVGDGALPTPPGPPPSEPPRPTTRRTRVAILLTFLGAFLLLLVVFRAVLFPFLMAIFIAYLIEPVVAAFTRAPVFGVRWTRGPTIVLMYAVVLTGIFFTTSCAVHSVTGTVRNISHDVNVELSARGEAAFFETDDTEPAFEQDVRIPAGTRVVLVPHRASAAGAETPGAPPSEPSGEAQPPPEPPAPPPAAPAPPAPPALFE